jgi:hypothetical protein
VPIDKRKIRERRKGRKKEGKKGRYNPVTATAVPEPCALRPLHIATSFGQELPDFSSHQEVHSHLITLFNGEQFRDLRVSAPHRFPACGLPRQFPECILLVSPPTAVAEEVIPSLGHCPSAPPVVVLISVAEPFLVDSSGCMPRL